MAREDSDSSVIVIGRVAESAPKPPPHAEYRCGSTTRMALWAAPCPVAVVPLELRVAGSLPHGGQARGSDIRAPVKIEDAIRRATRSPVAFHPDGGDAA